MAKFRVSIKSCCNIKYVSLFIVLFNPTAFNLRPSMKIYAAVKTQFNCTCFGGRAGNWRAVH